MALASSTVLVSVFLRPECWIGRILATRPLVAIGQISYGIYLFHAPLLIAFESRLGAYADDLEAHHYLLVLGALSLTSVLVAAIHYRLVERRFLAMRKPRSYIAPRGKHAPAAA